MSQILHYKPAGLLLPCLRTLRWHDQCPVAALHFLHAGLTAISIGQCRNNEISLILDYLPDRSSLLEDLKLEFRETVDAETLPDFAQLETLKCLRKLTLDFFDISTWSMLVQVVASLPSIEQVKMSKRFYGRRGAGYQVSPQPLFDPTVKPGALSRLRDLELPIDAIQCTEVLDKAGLLPKVISLKLSPLQAPYMCGPIQLYDFFATAARVCPNLRKLHLVTHVLHPDDVAKQMDEIHFQNITLETILPLLSHGSMSEFALWHPLPVELTLDQLVTLSKSWPHLEILNLSPSPSSLKLDHANDLKALQILAERCPDLIDLGLVLDASSVDITFDSQAPIFRRLEHLRVGNSDILEDGDAPSFLAQVLPLECKISYGSPADDKFTNPDHGSGDFLTARNRRYSTWQHMITKVLPVMRRLVKFQNS